MCLKNGGFVDNARRSESWMTNDATDHLLSLEWRDPEKAQMAAVESRGPLGGV